MALNPFLILSKPLFRIPGKKGPPVAYWHLNIDATVGSAVEYRF
jgi:hypothetical protein